MTSGEFKVTIPAPPERVWAWVADLTKHPEWSPKPYRVEWVSGEPNAIGSRYRSVGWIPMDKNHENVGEIVESHPYDRFALRADDELGPFQNTFTLTPVGDATEVTFRLVFPKVKGVNAIMIPLMFPLVGKPDLRKRMQLLKIKVEASG
jgi:uncharacterized protein YndB with AHSA1/START domain